MPLDEGHGIEDLVGEVPRGGPFSTGARQSAGITGTPMLVSFLLTDSEASGVKAL